jgi:hypothetical protein
MNQGFLGQTKAQREDDFKDNSIIIQSCEIDEGKRHTRNQSHNCKQNGENNIRFSKHPFIWDISAFFFFPFGKISLLGDKEHCTVNPAKSCKLFF